MLVPMVLAPENIVLKEINGSVITAQELVEYFKVGAPWIGTICLAVLLTCDVCCHVNSGLALHSLQFYGNLLSVPVHTCTFVTVCVQILC